MYLKICLIMVMLVLIQGCYYDIVQPNDPNKPPEFVSFSGDLQPIFDASCNTSGCHDGAHAPNLKPEESYNAIVNGGFVNIAIPDQSILYKVLQSGSMPPTGKLPP